VFSECVSSVFFFFFFFLLDISLDIDDGRGVSQLL